MTPKDKEAIIELLRSLSYSVANLSTVVQDYNVIMFLNEMENSIDNCLDILD